VPGAQVAGVWQIAALLALCSFGLDAVATLLAVRRTRWHLVAPRMAGSWLAVLAAWGVVTYLSAGSPLLLVWAPLLLFGAGVMADTTRGLRMDWQSARLLDDALPEWPDDRRDSDRPRWRRNNLAVDGGATVGERALASLIGADRLPRAARDGFLPGSACTVFNGHVHYARPQRSALVRAMGRVPERAAWCVVGLATTLSALRLRSAEWEGTAEIAGLALVLDARAAQRPDLSVGGRHSERAARVLGPDLAERLAYDDSFRLQKRGSALLLYRRGRFESEQEVRALVRMGAEIVSRLGGSSHEAIAS